MNFGSKGSRLRRLWLTVLSVPLVVGVAAIASADVEKTWESGEILTADDLNRTFAAIDDRITALEAATPTVTVAEDSAETEETSAFGADLVYQSMSLDLTPGTWRIEAFAAVTTTENPDGVQIGLWDDTNDEELDGSRGPYATTVSYAAGGALAACDGITTFCSVLMASTSKVVTLSAATTVRLAAFRNGGSSVRVLGGSNIALTAGNRLVATKLD